MGATSPGMCVDTVTPRVGTLSPEGVILRAVSLRVRWDSPQYPAGGSGLPTVGVSWVARRSSELPEVLAL